MPLKKEDPNQRWWGTKNENRKNAQNKNNAYVRRFPSFLPSFRPSVMRSFLPPFLLSFPPSVLPSFLPSVRPSTLASFLPSVRPSVRPLVRPFVRSSVRPCVRPSVRPSVRFENVFLKTTLEVIVFEVTSQLIGIMAVFRSSRSYQTIIIGA